MAKKTPTLKQVFAEGKATDVTEEMERHFLNQIITNMEYLIALLKKYPDMCQRYINISQDIEFILKDTLKPVKKIPKAKKEYTFTVKDDQYGQCKSNMVSAKQTEKEVIKAHKKVKK